MARLSAPLPAEKKDLAEIVAVFDVAFQTDPHFPHFHPHTPPEMLSAFDLKIYQDEFEKEGRRFFKIVDLENGKIAAFSKWYFPHEQAEADKKYTPKSFPQGSNDDLINSFFEKLHDGQQKYLKHNDMYFVSILAVHPDYQRQGLGSKLLEPILEQADREGRKTYIESSRKGLGLYKKLGWNEVDDMLVDVVPYGGHEVGRTVFLVREPRGHV